MDSVHSVAPDSIQQHTFFPGTLLLPTLHLCLPPASCSPSSTVVISTKKGWKHSRIYLLYDFLHDYGWTGAWRLPHVLNNKSSPVALGNNAQNRFDASNYNFLINLLHTFFFCLFIPLVFVLRAGSGCCWGRGFLDS